MDKDRFVAGNAALVDLTRLTVYGLNVLIMNHIDMFLLGLSVAAVFARGVAGRTVLQKGTIMFVRWLVAPMLYNLGGLLAAGLIGI